MQMIAIAAVSNNGVIGKDGKIPWRQKRDLQYFRKMTKGYTVVMGRLTFLSIGRPLPQRQNIIVSTSMVSCSEYTVVRSIPELLNSLQQQNLEKCFIIGGQKVYEETLEFCQKLLITRVHCEVAGDCYFPEIPNNFVKHEGDFFQKDQENEFDTHLETWIKT